MGNLLRCALCAPYGGHGPPLQFFMDTCIYFLNGNSRPVIARSEATKQ
ncbi:MAG: hypothetical protein K0R24_1965 [Gammaproteobacteria bacterium]|jgi:hypothetical protein|nr:hypothetical protein [Gammaproteobacteria bacterium]